ncbi:LADA_0H03400g1_1 [Lachancea dasiensis]|uniref:LADA_0H03400g1_1 n=1 Tax=Lachancea dasiensis TaxID=1072105 RepID=A0A1G4K0H5_9SACH|nr:LADA_0H03400g1_1 [Lachancea dasiensis]
MRKISEENLPSALENVTTPEDVTIKDAIEKTADYVSRNGPEFEQKLDLEQFPFIEKTDPFHTYYRQLVYQKSSNSVSKSSPDSEDKIIPLVEAPYQFVFSTAGRNVSKRDLEIVKRTALYCVMNEDVDYLKTLRIKCADIPSLGFLKLEHPLNPIFTSYVNQYKQVELKDYGVRASMHKEGRIGLLVRCFERAKHAEYTEKVQVQEVGAREHFKIKFSAYAWDQFDIIGKVDFEEVQSFAEPLDFDMLSRKTLYKKTLQDTFGRSLLISSLENPDTSVEKEGVKPKKRSKMKIRAAGETRLKHKPRLTSEALVECPITHKMIPESNFDKHIQVLISDPNYSKERQEYEAKNNITNLTLESVHQNIKRLSKLDGTRQTKKQRI